MLQTEQEERLENIRDANGGRKTACRILLMFLILAWCMTIFFLSAEPATASGERSGEILKIIQKFLGSLFGESIATVLTDHIIRKSAHILAYFLLSLLCMTFTFTFKGNRFLLTAESIFFCFLYAESDEIHQIFVPGRSGQMSDVGIDMLGVFLAVGVSLLLRFCIVRIHRRKKQNTSWS